MGKGCPWFGNTGAGCHRRVDLALCLDEGVSGPAVDALVELDGAHDLQIVRSSELARLSYTARVPDCQLMQQQPMGTCFGVHGVAHLKQRAQTLGGRHERNAGDLFDALLRAAAAASFDCQVFVTDDSALLATDGDGRIVCLAPARALALAGLYLRSWGVDTVAQVNGGTHRTPFAQLYSDGAFDLLPSFPAWFSVSAKHAMEGRRGTAWAASGLSVYHRLARALRARDRMQASVQNDQNWTAADNSLFYFDTFVLELDAAFDALALATAQTHGWEFGRPQDASWSSPAWRKQLRAQNEGAWRLVTQGAGAKLSELLSRLRNTIHGPVLSPVGVLERGARHRRLRVELSGGDTAAGVRVRVIASARGCGGCALWGIDAATGLLDPSRFVETAIVRVPQLLDNYMAALCPPGTTTAPGPVVPGTPTAHELRKRVPLLLGLPVTAGLQLLPTEELLSYLNSLVSRE